MFIDFCRTPRTGKGKRRRPSGGQETFVIFAISAAPSGSWRLLGSLGFLQKYVIFDAPRCSHIVFCVFFEIQVFKTIGFSCLKVPPYRILRHSNK